MNLTLLFLCIAAVSGRDVLQPGIYEYIFSFKLPDVLPSSYESTYGSIRYKVKGVVDRPWRFDYKAEAVFKVNAPVDLNNYPQYRVRNNLFEGCTTIDFCFRIHIFYRRERRFIVV